MSKGKDIFASIFFMCTGVGFVIGGIGFRLGTSNEPQPGFFPFLGGITLISLSATLFFQAWRGQSKGAQAFGNLWGIISVVLALAFYVLTLNMLGYVITTTILTGIILRVLETKSWGVLIIFSLILAVGSYILFDRILGVPLPDGILAGIR